MHHETKQQQNIETIHKCKQFNSSQCLIISVSNRSLIEISRNNEIHRKYSREKRKKHKKC